MNLTRTPDHRYRLGDGPFVPGATGTTRIMEKGWRFDNWMKTEVAKSAVRRLDFLNTLIAEGGPEAAIAWLVKLPDWERDKAANVGSQVHDLADQIAKDGKPSVPNELVPFVQAELRFLRDYKPTKRRSEVMVYSHKGYGATVDEVSRLDGATAIIERKTGKNVYPDLVRMQLAAQKYADLIGPGNPTADGGLEAAKTYAMPKIGPTFVLHLRPEQYATGYRLIEFDVTDADFEAFLACLALTRWRAGLNGKGN